MTCTVRAESHVWQRSSPRLGQFKITIPPITPRTTMSHRLARAQHVQYASQSAVSRQVVCAAGSQGEADSSAPLPEVDVPQTILGLSTSPTDTQSVDITNKKQIKIGILGGGQLGRMTAIAAARMHLSVAVLDPTPSCPASSVATQVEGSFKDFDDVVNFGRECDVVTIEIEHVDVRGMYELEKAGVRVQPRPQTVEIIQDKFRQKEHFSSNSIPLAPYARVTTDTDVTQFAALHGYPLVLKTTHSAYDGRGNYVIQSEDDVAEAVGKLGGGVGLYVEAWAPFERELAVMVVKDGKGGVYPYPVVETHHKNNICHVTEAPADIPYSIQQDAVQLACKAVETLPGAGVFGVEMFLLPTTANPRVLINEVAPRPHNSGHWTQDGCLQSQFDNHVRAILGWGISNTDMCTNATIMYNVLGKGDDAAAYAAAGRVLTRAVQYGCQVEWYGKALRAERKVGHVNIVGKTREAARKLLAKIDEEAAEKLTPSTSKDKPVVSIIMGSDSDLPIMLPAYHVCQQFNIPAEITIVSAHRTPDRMFEFAKSAASRGIHVIIAGAGGAAHLPGMVAAITPVPVIGVPVKPVTHVLDGTDALLSIVQMPRGVPVATVAINNSENAGLLAVRILGAGGVGRWEGAGGLLGAMGDYQEGLKDKVMAKIQKVEEEYGGQ